MTDLRHREPRYRNGKLLYVVREISCTADWPHDCLHQSEAAHSNWSRHGKGKSIKAHDCFVAALCRNAHMELDQGSTFGREDRERIWQRCHERTFLQLWQKELIRVGDFDDVIRAQGEQTRVVSEPSLRRTPLRRRQTKTKFQNGHNTGPTSKTVEHPARKIGALS